MMSRRSRASLSISYFLEIDACVGGSQSRRYKAARLIVGAKLFSISIVPPPRLCRRAAAASNVAATLGARLADDCGVNEQLRQIIVRFRASFQMESSAPRQKLTVAGNQPPILIVSRGVAKPRRCLKSTVDGANLCALRRQSAHASSARCWY